MVTHLYWSSYSDKNSEFYVNYAGPESSDPGNYAVDMDIGQEVAPRWRPYLRTLCVSSGSISSIGEAGSQTGERESEAQLNVSHKASPLRGL